MAVRLIRADEALPPPDEADSSGLVAVGGDLSTARLLDGYQRGIFPWYEEGLPILWHSPDPRYVLRPSKLHVNRSLRKALRRGTYQIRLDGAFREVISACAQSPRPGQDGTWITGEMVDAYCQLFEQGHAHCVEARHEGELVGGLYGVQVGAVFCGESMFSCRPDASKIAFVHMVRQLERWGVQLIDCQVHTEHLERFGAENWTRKIFLERIKIWTQSSLPALVPGRWNFDPDFDPVDGDDGSKH